MGNQRTSVWINNIRHLTKSCQWIEAKNISRKMKMNCHNVLINRHASAYLNNFRNGRRVCKTTAAGSSFRGPGNVCQRRGRLSAIRIHQRTTLGRSNSGWVSNQKRKINLHLVLIVLLITQVILPIFCFTQWKSFLLNSQEQGPLKVS